MFVPLIPYDLLSQAHTCCPATPKGRDVGGWDSIHVFEAIDRGRSSHYKLTSTVILHLGAVNESLGEMDLSGNMTRQAAQEMPVDDDGSHIVNIGKMIEDMESKIRNMTRRCDRAISRSY